MVSRRALLGAGALLLVGCGPPDEPEVIAGEVWGEQLRASQRALAAYPASISPRAKASERVRAFLDGGEVRQAIVVPGKLVNLVVE
jgi:leucyl-tRNA synthetase